MKKPEKPFNPNKFCYMPECNKIYLSSTNYVHPDFIEEAEENWKFDNENVENAEMPKFVEWWYHTEVFNLKELLSMIPKDSNPEDIIVEIYRDREIRDITISVIHKTTIDKAAWKTQELAEQKEYEKKLAVYEIEKLNYDEWLLKKEIKEKQAALKKLKNKT